MVSKRTINIHRTKYADPDPFNWTGPLIPGMYIYVYVHMYIHVCVHIYSRIHVFIKISLNICLYLSLCINYMYPISGQKVAYTPDPAAAGLIPHGFRGKVLHFNMYIYALYI
jgi:hypothetical protein